MDKLSAIKENGLYHALFCFQMAFMYSSYRLIMPLTKSPKAFQDSSTLLVWLMLILHFIISSLHLDPTARSGQHPNQSIPG
jgi:hypothetical protein